MLIAPTVPYGATDDLMGFPGTVSLGVQGLIDVLMSICDSLYAYGARRFVFVNGHGGNVKSIATVCSALNEQGCIAVLMNWWKMAPQLNPAWGGGHGDGMETSANLAIDPESVDMTALAPEALRDDFGPSLKTTGWVSVEWDGVSVDMPRPLVRMASNGWATTTRPRPPAPSWARPCSRARPTTSPASWPTCAMWSCPSRCATRTKPPRDWHTSRVSRPANSNAYCMVEGCCKP